MTTQKEVWISTKEASDILTESNGRVISEAYVRRLGNMGKIAFKQVDGRTRLYLKSDAQSYKVQVRGTGEVRRAARAKKASIA